MSTLAPEEAKGHRIEINGYAIVSDDDRIAGPDGLIPASPRNEKDWGCFQRALASSDLVEQHANVWLWNPARMSWMEVAKELLPRGGDVAVPGVQVVFDLFLKIGFDAFHLTRAQGVSSRGASALFGLRRRSLSRGCTRQWRVARQRKHRARCRARRRHECLVPVR
jgi:hypothetical protein